MYQTIVTVAALRGRPGHSPPSTRSLRSLTSVACFRALGPSPVAPCVAVLNGVQVGADVIQQFNRHGELVAEVARFLGRLRVHLWSKQWSCACRRNAGECLIYVFTYIVHVHVHEYSAWCDACMNKLHHPMDLYMYRAAVKIIGCDLMRWRAGLISPQLQI